MRRALTVGLVALALAGCAQTPKPWVSPPTVWKPGWKPGADWGLGDPELLAPRPRPSITIPPTISCRSYQAGSITSSGQTAIYTKCWHN